MSAAEAAAVSEAAAVVAWFRARQRRKGKQCIWLKHGVEIWMHARALDRSACCVSGVRWAQIRGAGGDFGRWAISRRGDGAQVH